MAASFAQIGRALTLEITVRRKPRKATGSAIAGWQLLEEAESVARSTTVFFMGVQASSPTFFR